MDAVQFVNHGCLKWMQYSSWTTDASNGCSTVREPQMSQMDTVQFVNHRCLKWMQYSSWTTDVLKGCSTVREPQVS